MLKQIKRYALVILICLILSPSKFSQIGRSITVETKPVQVVNTQTIHNWTAARGLIDLLPNTQEDPTVLLFGGLALFIGATSLRRKRARLINRPSDNIESTLNI